MDVRPKLICSNREARELLLPTGEKFRILMGIIATHMITMTCIVHMNLSDKDPPQGQVEEEGFHSNLESMSGTIFLDLVLGGAAGEQPVEMAMVDGNDNN